MSAASEDLERLVELSARMVNAAQAQDWDALANLGRDYFPLFEQASPSMRSPSAQQLLLTLSGNERLIRDCVEPWMAATSSLLDTWTTLINRQPDSPSG